MSITYENFVNGCRFEHRLLFWFNSRILFTYIFSRFLFSEVWTSGRRFSYNVVNSLFRGLV